MTSNAAKSVETAQVELSIQAETLRARPTAEVVTKLGEVVELFRDPNSKIRQELLARLPDATGFSSGMVAEGLRKGFDAWSADDLRATIERELGPLDILDGAERSPRVTGFETTAVILAGTIPMPSLLALLWPLALKSPVLVKPARHDPVTPALAAQALREVDPQLGQCLEIVDFASTDDEASAALLRSPCIVATGSDDSITALSRRIEPTQRFVGYGHRLSLGVIDGEAIEPGPALDALAERFALDVTLWDQLGCLSPVGLYVVGGGLGIDHLSDALATALAKAEGRWPRGKIDPGTGAVIREQRAEAELRNSIDDGIQVFASSGTQWTVLREHGSAFRPSPLHRFIRLYPTRDLYELKEALRPLGPHLAGVALHGFEDGRQVLVEELMLLGASRVCTPGTLQSPPLGWHHDNRELLLPLARCCDIEV